ncbi:MAG: T9SS type A sorting domain-containing protein [Bacteroidia bacterium]|nr:T9SS type A sorting domain-containing protein [Bacteroidia bacterium]
MYGPYASQTAFSNPFYSNNSDLNYLAFGANSDFYPEDGWELIQWGFGRMLNGSTEFNASGHQRSVPVLILYNRHTGMLHVFGAYNDFTSQVFQVELRFTAGEDFPDPDPNRPTYKPAGMLGYANPIAQPLGQPTTVSEVLSRSPFPNDPIKFVHAAFPIAYDPCVCQNDAAFRVYFRPITSMDINLYGRLAATSYSPAEYYNGGTAQFEDFLNAVYTDGSNNIVAGTQVYQDASKMFDDLQAEMQATGKFDILEAMNVMKAYLELGAEILDPITIDLGVLKLKANYSVKVMAKAVSFAQSVIKFKKSGEPPKPSLALPAITRGEITMSGEINSSSNPQHATEFAVPGSKNSWSLPEANYTQQPYYPLYNEELGVFALLETPVVNRYVNASMQVTSTPCEAYGVPSPTETETHTHYAASYRLAAPLKYAINPAARMDLANSDISAALMIRSKHSPDFTSMSGVFSTTNVTFGNLEEGADEGVYYTPFLPVECLENLTSYLTRDNISCWTPYSVSPDTIFLVFANTYLSSTRGRDGYPILSQQILTFPVVIQDVSSPLPVSPSIPFDVTVSGTVSTDVKAWRKITINGNITVSSLRTFTAGESIVISPDVLIPADVLLQTGVQPIACAAPNLPYTPAQLQTYCTSTKYKANQLSQKGLEYAAHDRSDPAPQPLPAQIPLAARPNPFSDAITFSFSLEQEDQVSLRVLDLAGRTVALLAEGERMDAGTQDLTLPGSGLAPGIYLAVLETSRGRQTLRVVKQ